MEKDGAVNIVQFTEYFVGEVVENGFQLVFAGKRAAFATTLTVGGLVVAAIKYLS